MDGKQLQRQRLDVHGVRHLSVSGKLQTWLNHLASPKLTVLALLLMASAAVGASHFPTYITTLVLPPVSLLLINLLAALLVHPRLRFDLPLLVFHLALVAFLVLIALARLTYFDAGVKLNAGAAFNGQFQSVARGPLHMGEPERLRFSHEQITEHLPVAGGYPITEALVTWWDAAGRPRLAEIGNDRPLALDGYRIFVTSQRGYSPVFSYLAGGTAQAQAGTAQLSDSYLERGIRDFVAGTDIQLPGGGAVWVQVIPDSVAEQRAMEQDLGVASLKHRLVIREGDVRHELRPGEFIELRGGRFSYQGLSNWVGYRITYDPTPPWLAATVVVAVVSLIWFYLRLLLKRRQPGVLGVIAR